MRVCVCARSSVSPGGRQSSGHRSAVRVPRAGEVEGLTSARRRPGRAVS